MTVPYLNETLIVLVPKTKTAERMEELRPINLCKVTMKINSKVLANRIKEVMDKIISPNQSAFIQGRLISDNIIVAHELSHFISNNRSRRPGYMSVKLDLSKAFDRLEWKFLEKMCLALGFAEEWVEKIMSCVKSVSYRIKVNDHISERLIPERGIRQGDPLSPYLFLISAEWFTMAMDNLSSAGSIKGIQISPHAPEVSHLLFADDCLMFLEASSQAVRTIKELLVRYEAISGQSANLSKSDVVCSAGVSNAVKEDIIRLLGMCLVAHHGRYLGLPNFFGRDKGSIFNSLNEKFKRKCADWKSKLLSAAGKEILIKSVLQAIPIYALSCFKIPKGASKKLVSRVLDFWWDRKEGGRRAYWIKKELLFLKKEDGGMGFKWFDHFNNALLTKQAWRILTEPELLVSRILLAKYCHGMSLRSATLGPRPSFAWRSIYSVLGLLRQNTEWVEDRNEYFWLADSSKEFTVKSAYDASVRMERNTNGSHGEPSDSSDTGRFWKWFWKLNLPNKIKIFGWRLYYNGLPTAGNLSRRGCRVNMHCRLCGLAEEESIHLAKNCWWTKAILWEWNLPKEIWDLDCRDSGYWIWICARICSTDDFKMLLCGIWLSWFNRNLIEHGRQAWDISMVKQKLRHLKLVCSKQMISFFDGSSEELQSLEDPVIYCDAAWDSDLGVAGLCAVLKHNSCIMRVRADRIGSVQSAAEAEGYAIELGMRLAAEAHVRVAVITSYSSAAVDSIGKGVWKSSINPNWLSSCQRLWKSFPGWRLGLIARDFNLEVDAWARKARIEGWSWNCSDAIPRLPVD